MKNESIKETRYWFYLEPYVYAASQADRVLLYNTLNGERLELSGNVRVQRFVQRLLLRKNLLVVEVKEIDLRDADLAPFLAQVKEAYMGDWFPQRASKGRPIQIVPEIKVMQGSEQFVTEQLKRNISEISIYLNGDCPQGCRFCADYHRQFLFCTRTTPQSEVQWPALKKLLEEAQHSSLKRINLLGGNVLAYPQLDDLLASLAASKVIKKLFVHLANMEGAWQRQALFHDGLVFLQVLITGAADKSLLCRARQNGEKLGLQLEFLFVVQNEDEYEHGERLAADLHIDQHIFMPFYNGDNMDFFKKNVFLTRADIVGAKPTQKEIFIRQTLNRNHFGKLLVSSRGEVFADIHQAPVGRLGHDSLYDIVARELRGGNSWRLVRGAVEPCRNCVYAPLCPPLSHYEAVLGRNNLCQVHDAR